jgi:DNA repair photolyase
MLFFVTLQNETVKSTDKRKLGRMSLTISKGNMYSWVTHTWNTIKGECPHGCTYCYMHRWGNQKPVRFDEKELKTDLGTGNFIFVGSSCDMFAKDIPDEWIEKTLYYCDGFENTYLFQSKNPDRIINYDFPDKTCICTTIETNRVYPCMEKCPTPINRAGAMMNLYEFKRYITIEPIMDFDIEQMVELIKWCKPEQVNIGADSGNNHLPEPSKEKILELISELKKFTIIDQKKNLARLLN